MEKNFKINKKGQTGYSTIFIYRLFLILLLIIGVVFIVGSHFSKPIDIRPLEAQQLSKITYNCIKNIGLDNLNEISLDYCFPYNKGENGIKIFYDDKNFLFGKELIINLCEAKDKTKSKVACSTSDYFIEENNKIKKITILVGISKVNKNL